MSAVNLHVKRGEIHSLIGQNKAGITSLLKLLTGLWKPTSGEIELFGERIDKNAYLYLEKMGSVIESPIFYEHRTGFENLMIHGAYLGIYDHLQIIDALALFDLQGMEHNPVRSYSFGLKQKLGIIRAIVMKPELLILDEPMKGLDPIEKKELRQVIRNINHQYGTTVIISSHHLEDLEQITDTVGVIHDGKLIKEEAMEQIKAKSLAYIDLTTNDDHKTAYLLEKKLHIQHFQVLHSGQIRIFKSPLPVHEIVNQLVTHHIQIHEITQNQHPLERYILNCDKGSEKH
nr:ABC transporter ATP-binding protein [Polycladospora coralii]